MLINFLIKPFWIFGIDRTVQNTVTAEEYGTYFALFNFSMLFNILLDLGITNYNNRNISQHSQLLSKYFSGIIAFKFMLAIVYFIVTFITGYVLGYNSERFYLMVFLSLNQFLISFIQYLRSNISGLQLYMLDSLFSVLDKTLMIIFCAVLLWGNLFSSVFTLHQFVYAQFLAYLIAAIILFITVYKKAEKIYLKINLPFLIIIIKQTFPYALLVLTMTFYYRMDVIMLDYMLEDGEYQSSLYAQAYRLMDASNQIGVLFAGLLLPMFAFMIKDKKRLDKLVKLSFSLLFIPAVVLALITYIYSSQIMTALYENNTLESSLILPVLMFCFVAIASTYIFGTLLTANGSLKQLNILATGGMVINILLNWLMIPLYKAYGSALASMITQFLIVFIQIILVVKIFKFQINYKYLIGLFIFLILLIISVFIIQKLKFDLMLGISSIILIALLLGLILRVINLKQMLHLFLNREIAE
ncbi:MAG: polysaccharide biosynthesis C-terminal domain-containing protein [Flavobacteriales bacterium]|nr:polysaccharide biosynthesis C-terminal domain-containing protein [Flavobacteriales bacterium]